MKRVKNLLAEPKITVGHRTISDHFWQLSDQKSICSDKVSGQSDNKDNIIPVYVRPKIPSNFGLVLTFCLDILKI